MEWILSLKEKNELLFWFGLFNMALTLIFLILSRVYPIQLVGTNAWFKPIKFSSSITILSWTMAYFTGYLNPGRDIEIYNWVMIITLGFEIIYIGIQAGRGMLSHFNLSSPVYAALYSLMAIAASLATLGTAYIGLKFFTEPFPDLADYYLWAIRLGIILFVIFSFEGFVMGSRLSHTIGGPDGGSGLPFLNWSRKFGDPRVAHFIGMHALQILPLLSFYFLKNVRLTFAVGLLYLAIAVWVLLQAFQGKPFLKFIS
ncbi:MAG: hypothetical protein MRZ79_12655 [Bacteroidia bacterium]|nr:hypothetical protein [Bacteroidia bacterium]